MLDIALSLEDKETHLECTQGTVCVPYLGCDFPHASVTFDPKRPYCTPDTANTDTIKYLSTLLSGLQYVKTALCVRIVCINVI